MPSKHPRSSRMAARRTNFTSKSDLQSEGEFIHDEVSTMSSTDDAPTQSAPSPTRTPSTPSTNSASKSEEKSLAQIMATYGSPGSSSNPAVWGYGENTHSTPFTVQDAEEQFPRLQVVPTERSPPTSQQSTVSSSSALPHATPRFSLSPRRTRTPAPTPPAIVVKLDAATQTSTPTTLTAAARSLIRANPAAALLASSIMHQAASAIQRRFKRHVTRTEFFRKKAESLIARQENIHFAKYLSRVLALHSFYFGGMGTLDSPENHPQTAENHSELQHKQKFGGFPLSVVDARALQLTRLSIDKQSCLSSSKVSLLGNSSWTIFHAPETNGTSTSFGPYTQTAETIPLDLRPVPTCNHHMPISPRKCERQTVTVVSTWLPYPRGSHRIRTIKITQELGRSLNQLELRKAPRVRLRLKHASLSAYQRVITPKLKFQYQASTVPTTAPTSAFTSLVPVSSMFTNQRQGNSTQDARTVLSSVRSWSDRRNSSPTPSFDNFVPSFMRDTIITRAAELMSDMQLFATNDVSPQENNDSESAGGPNRENTAELTQRRDEPANRWMRSSHTSARDHALLDHDHNASTNNDDTSDRSESRDIQFGLSPSAVFDRAENYGSYREFENRNDEGIQRGFDFRIDANRGNNHSSATPSDCNDDYNSSNDEDEDHSSNGNNH